MHQMNKPAKYQGLSKDELYLISRAEYEKQKLLTGDYAKSAFNDAKKAANILDKLKRKGRLIQIERGKYFIVPIKSPNQLWSPNEFIAAKYWMGETPYYLGYFSMYNYWGFTEQIPQTVFVLNTGKSRPKTIGGVRYKAVKIGKNKYYGVIKVKIEDEEICISDKERTLVDFIYKPLGSFENINRVLKRNIDKINMDKFIGYLSRFPMIAVRRRAGYLLANLNVSKLFLDRLKKSIGKANTMVTLDPSGPRSGKINKEWGIIVNR
jgi:predicted transcriptional regulator of viral defense system